MVPATLGLHMTWTAEVVIKYYHNAPQVITKWFHHYFYSINNELDVVQKKTHSKTLHNLEYLMCHLESKNALRMFLKSEYTMSFFFFFTFKYIIQLVQIPKALQHNYSLHITITIVLSRDIKNINLHKMNNRCSEVKNTVLWPVCD